MESTEKLISVNGEDYRLVLDETPGNEWPWFVNAYEASARGFIMPVRFHRVGGLLVGLVGGLVLQCKMQLEAEAHE